MLSFSEIVTLVLIGYFLRFVVIALFFHCLKFMTNKKKRKKFNLPNLNDRSKIFLGYVGILSTIYLGFVDYYRPRPITATELNSIIWFGMFLPNIIAVVIQHLKRKSENDDSSNVSSSKHVLRSKKRTVSRSSNGRRSNIKQSS
jgi:hypothetical protein